MTTTEILKQEINKDLKLLKGWREMQYNAKTPEAAKYYKGCAMRSIYRVEAKCDIAMALGYRVLFTDQKDECISVYSLELDD